MKLLFCTLCGDIVAPDRRPRQPRHCACKTFAVWWENPQTGQLKVWAKNGARQVIPSARIVGLHNALLQDEAWKTERAYVEAALALTPDSYLFKQANSLAIKFGVGATGDVTYTNELPESARPVGSPCPCGCGSRFDPGGDAVPPA